jgi:hypothetical protein
MQTQITGGVGGGGDVLTRSEIMKSIMTPKNEEHILKHYGEQKAIEDGGYRVWPPLQRYTSSSA